MEREELENEGNELEEEFEAHSPDHEDEHEQSAGKRMRSSGEGGGSRQPHRREEGEGEEEEEDEVSALEELDLKPEDLEQIAVLYDSIRGVRRRLHKDQDKALAEDFDQHLKTVMFELSDSLKSDLPVYLKNANILKAKISLFDICFTKANEYLRMGDADTGSIFDRIQDGHTSIFKEFLGTLRFSIFCRRACELLC